MKVVQKNKETNCNMSKIIVNKYSYNDGILYFNLNSNKVLKWNPIWFRKKKNEKFAYIHQNIRLGLDWLNET